MANAYSELADAMRKGAALRPQATDGDCFEVRSVLEPFASCAIGAAVEATYGPYLAIRDAPNWDEAADWLYEAFPCVAEPAPTCPEPTCDSGKSFHMSWDSRDCLQDLINHLNDEHTWTRHAIADWPGSRDARRPSHAHTD